MPLMNIMPFCDIFKEVIRLSITTILRESKVHITIKENSMFFGSHEGAGRAAILYSIAISCRLNGINLFEYICDVIEKTAEWQPNTPWENIETYFLTDGKSSNSINQLLLEYARYKTEPLTFYDTLMGLLGTKPKSLIFSLSYYLSSL